MKVGFNGAGSGSASLRRKTRNFWKPLPTGYSSPRKFTVSFRRKASGNGDRHAMGPIADGALEAPA